jgi:hypothetical protein
MYVLIMLYGLENCQPEVLKYCASTCITVNYRSMINTNVVLVGDSLDDCGGSVATDRGV